MGHWFIQTKIYKWLWRKRVALYMKSRYNVDTARGDLIAKQFQQSNNYFWMHWPVQTFADNHIKYNKGSCE